MKLKVSNPLLKMKYLKLLFYNLYSFLFNLRYFEFKVAMKRPLLIHPRVKIKNLYKGAIILKGNAKLVIGFDGTMGRSNCQSILSIKQGAHLLLYGYTTMARGTRLIIDSGCVEIGQNFFCNGDCIIRCTTSIKIGKDNMWGWNVDMNTSDGHPCFYDNKKKPIEGEIRVGNHVWLASHSIIHKSATIPNECVVAQRSLVINHFDKEHCLIGGMPAKIIKENFLWKEE